MVLDHVDKEFNLSAKFKQFRKWDFKRTFARWHGCHSWKCFGLNTIFSIAKDDKNCFALQLVVEIKNISIKCSLVYKKGSNKLSLYLSYKDCVLF
jgi:hypothetical protein